MKNFVKFNFQSRNWKRSMEKAKSERPLVRPAEHSESCAAYFVRGSAGDFYRVLIAGDDTGEPCFRCTSSNGSHCPAFAEGWHCYHVGAALLCHIGLVASGLRAPVSSFVSGNSVEPTDEEIDRQFRELMAEENLRRAFDTD